MVALIPFLNVHNTIPISDLYVVNKCSALARRPGSVRHYFTLALIFRKSNPEFRNRTQSWVRGINRFTVINTRSHSRQHLFVQDLSNEVLSRYPYQRRREPSTSKISLQLKSVKFVMICHKSLSRSRNSLPITEEEVTIPCLQEPTTVFRLETDHSSPHPAISSISIIFISVC